jgi:cell division protein FtsL
MRIVNISAVLLALASAFLLYGLSYDTRLVESRLQLREREAERARADIAVLRAERAHLARPERIEPLARSLGLEPLAARHLVPGMMRDNDNAKITTSSTSQ